MNVDVSFPWLRKIVSPVCRRRVWLAKFYRLLLAMALSGSAGLLIQDARAGEAKLAEADGLFRLTNIVTVHLRLTPEQWEAMEPKGGGGFFGGGGFRGGPRGPGGPGGGGPGPAMFLAPAFLEQGDLDSDGKLSRAEFRGLGEKWFTAWDQKHIGRLNGETLRAGLSTTFVPRGMGRPGGGGGFGGGGPPLQGAEGKRNGLASASGVEFNYVHADLEIDGQSFRDVGVRYKGNGTFMQSRDSLNRSFKMHLNEFVKGRKLAGVSTLNLHNNITDASWMNEPLAHRLFRDAGVPAPRTTYARVFVTVTGNYERRYLGLYSVVENLDKSFAGARFGTKRGAIFKPVTRSLFEYRGDDWAKYEQTYDPKTSLTPEQKQRVLDFARLVSQADDAAFDARLGEFLDLDEFARFLAVTVWTSSLDSLLTLGQNYLVYLHPGTQRFSFWPWDLDHAFGQFPLIGTREQREQLSLQKPWQGENRFLERVFKVDAFKKLYLAKLGEFGKTIFTPERLQRQVDELAPVLRPAVQEESTEKLTRFDKVVAGEAVEPQRFGPSRGGGEPPQPIKGFVTARARSVNEQLAGKSTGAMLDQFGFGGRGGPGGPGGGRGGPGEFLGGAFLAALDADQNGEITKDEFLGGFDKWFRGWNTGKNGLLTEEELRQGINRDLSPFRGEGPPGAPPAGPPK